VGGLKHGKEVEKVGKEFERDGNNKGKRIKEDWKDAGRRTGNNLEKRKRKGK